MKRRKLEEKTKTSEGDKKELKVKLQILKQSLKSTHKNNHKINKNNSFSKALLILSEGNYQKTNLFSHKNC
ncbi:hypothetical protein [endosymbiont GvMRE of Glomus versiforme]|uniref:hypothetical protein n=1 Tax=endosymbiont GvMRE of Glomus versiforme TaxID=2039283 RepID=UPI000EE78061|nr:hypothetical protein [endosymbiont GvMRE of Glomus versiforme]RHZ35402.1 hypothetical protein GvMRE_IIg552 [endosymbiont GvMRE of Glomus versiforme]